MSTIGQATNRPALSQLTVASLLWLVATSAGWFAYLFAHLILAALTFGSTLSCLTIFTPVIAAIIGAAQERILRGLEIDEAEGWMKRTVLGWLLGLVAFWLVIAILNSFFHFQSSFFDMGFFMVGGHQNLVMSVVIAWIGMGTVLGAFQWRKSSERSNVLGSLKWTIINMVAWGAAALVSWTIYRSYPEFGQQSICIDCVLRLFWSGLGSGVTIALLTAAALLNRALPVGLGLLVAVALIFQVTQTTQHAGQTVFDARHLYPTRDLVTDSVLASNATSAIGFSADGKLLAATRDERQQGEVVSRRTVLWRTSDWQEIGSLDTEGEEFTIDYYGVKALASISLEDGMLHVRDASNSVELAAVSLVHPKHPPPGVNLEIRAPSFARAELHRVMDSSAPGYGTPVAYLRIPPSVDWSRPNPLVTAWSPDGRLIAAGSKNGGVWIWEVP